APPHRSAAQLPRTPRECVTSATFVRVRRRRVSSRGIPDRSGWAWTVCGFGVRHNMSADASPLAEPHTAMPCTRQPMAKATNRVFTARYCAYLALWAAPLGLLAWIVAPRRAPTLADMLRPDFHNDPQHILQKIDRDGVLFDLRPSARKVYDGVTYVTNNAG